MYKKMIGVGTVLALIITAVSSNLVYAGMYGRAVAKSLQLNTDEHVSEMHAAKEIEAAAINVVIKDSLKPAVSEKALEMTAAEEYAEIIGKEITDHARAKQVESIVSGGTKGEYQLYAWSRFEEFGWNENDLAALIKLWNKESGWNTGAHNGSTGAHGIPQALPASKMAAYGSDYMTGYKTQIDWGLNYIAGRYGSPSRAWGHFCSCNWY